MWLCTNPVTAARHFQHRLDTFFTTVLRSNAQPLGNISDHMIRIEFQARGSPHAHCILWVADAPKLDQNSDEEVFAFIDKYQHGTFPTKDPELEELVRGRQTHVHNSTCLRRTICRYHIPKPIAPSTLIAREPSEDKNVTLQNAQQIMKQVQEIVSDLPRDSLIPTEDILTAACVSQAVCHKKCIFLHCSATKQEHV